MIAATSEPLLTEFRPAAKHRPLEPVVWDRMVGQ